MVGSQTYQILFNIAFIFSSLLLLKYFANRVPLAVEVYLTVMTSDFRISQSVTKYDPKTLNQKNFIGVNKFLLKPGFLS